MGRGFAPGGNTAAGASCEIGMLVISFAFRLLIPRMRGRLGCIILGQLRHCG
jgi:hypothetical protein